MRLVAMAFKLWLVWIMLWGLVMGGSVVPQFATWSFVMRLGSALMLEGYPFYANGWNSYWLMVAGSDESTRPRVDAVLRGGAALGLTVCRTWAFNDGAYQALQTSPGRYDEQVFQVGLQVSADGFLSRCTCGSVLCRRGRAMVVLH
jgi:hypothetical protein